MNDKCQHCGSPVDETWPTKYSCGTFGANHPVDSRFVDPRSVLCYERQIEHLKALLSAESS